MKHVLMILGLGALNFLFSLYTPWWIFVPLVIIWVAFFQIPRSKCFLPGIAIALSWLTMILLRDITNHHILATRMAHLFGLKGQYVLLIGINLFIPFLLATWTAYLSATITVAKVVMPKKR